jgi:hypothetical protein
MLSTKSFPSVGRLKMRILYHALCRALGHDLRIGGRIGVINLCKKTVECKVAGFLAARVLLAKVAAHAPYSANLTHRRALIGIVAKDMYHRRCRDKLDKLSWANCDTLAAPNAKTLIDFRKAINH